MLDNVYETINSKLKRISDDELRKCLGQIMTGLAEHQNDIRSSMMERLDKEIRANNKVSVPTVVTKLIGNLEESVCNNCFEVIDVGCFFFQDGDGSIEDNLFYQRFKFPEKQFFLSVPYEKKDEYTGKEHTYHAKYRGMSFEFWLRDNYRLVREENKILASLRMYGIVDPIIFSPWSRKAVDIELAAELDEEFVQKIKKNPSNVDWCLEENQLKGILLTDYLLAWNIKWKKDFESRNETVAPDDSIKSFEYKFRVDSERQYICIEDTDGVNFVHPDIEMVSYRDSQIHVISRAKLHNDENRDGIVDHAKLFVVQDTSEEKEEFFYNNSEFCVDKLRLRTEADIQWTLEKFKRNGFNCEYLGLGICSEYKKVALYRSDYEYYRDRKQIFYRTRGMCPKIMLKFKADNDKCNFLTDYANYVLYNLNYMYPEFCWMGVTE